VAAENSPIGVQFVYHDILKILEQARPLCMMWQNPGMEHIRIRKYDVATLADRLARIGRRIAVIGEDSERISQLSS